MTFAQYCLFQINIYIYICIFEIFGCLRERIGLREYMHMDVFVWVGACLQRDYGELKWVYGEQSQLICLLLTNHSHTHTVTHTCTHAELKWVKVLFGGYRKEGER